MRAVCMNPPGRTSLTKSPRYASHLPRFSALDSQRSTCLCMPLRASVPDHHYPLLSVHLPCHCHTSAGSVSPWQPGSPGGIPGGVPPPPLPVSLTLGPMAPLFPPPFVPPAPQQMQASSTTSVAPASPGAVPGQVLPAGSTGTSAGAVQVEGSRGGPSPAGLQASTSKRLGGLAGRTSSGGRGRIFPSGDD
jgi:hypothetical protein